MLQPKNLAIRKSTIRPPFTRTSVRMMTSRVSMLPVSHVKAVRHVSVVTVRSALSVMAAADRRVAVSVRTSDRRVAHVRTSPNV